MVASLSHIREINVTLGDVRGGGRGRTVDSMSHRAGKIPYHTLCGMSDYDPQIPTIPFMIFD